MSCDAVEEAVLLTCDVPTRQFILHVDETRKKQGIESFVIRKLDPTHLYVREQCLPLLHEKLQELQDSNTFTAKDAGPGLSSVGGGGNEDVAAPPAKKAKKKAPAAQA